MFHTMADAEEKRDRSGGKKVTGSPAQPEDKTPREPKWLPVRELIADSLPLEFAVTEETRDGRLTKRIRRQNVVCLRGIYPRQEQVESIVAALPDFVESMRLANPTSRVVTLPKTNPSKGPVPERLKKILDEPGEMTIPAFKADDLLQLIEFKMERQDAAEVPTSWKQVSWDEVSPDQMFEVLLSTDDFDEELAHPAECGWAITSELPKLEKGKWDNRILHPRLKENKLQPPTELEQKTLKDSARYVLFRYFDFDVKTGHSYRYRVRIVAANPVFMEKMFPPELAKGETRESPWSELSPVVTVGKSPK